MRVRIALLVVLGLMAAGGTATRAQSDDRPLMVNEVREWCEDYGLVGDTACDRASYETMPDGSLRVVFNFYAPAERLEDDSCVSGIHIPSDITGWAYAISGETRGVVTLSEVTSESTVCELIVSR